jgi:hypothetical protein
VTGEGPSPNLSICGIRYYISGEVAKWRNLANRTCADLEATGIQLHLDTLAASIDVAGRHLEVRNPDGSTGRIAYDELVVGTGALPVRPRMDGLDGSASTTESTCCTQWAILRLDHLAERHGRQDRVDRRSPARQDAPAGHTEGCRVCSRRFCDEVWWLARCAVQQDRGQAPSAREGCPWG